MHNKAPGWLRLLYIKEVLPKFIHINYCVSDEGFFGPISINELAERLCVRFRTELPHDGLEWEYVTEMIKNRANEFYEIVEIMGEILIEKIVAWAKDLERFVEIGENDPDENSYLNDLALELECGGYEVYQSVVNKIFLDNSIGYELRFDGKLISIDEAKVKPDEPVFNRKDTPEYSSTPYGRIYQDRFKNYIYNNIEESLHLLKNNDLLDREYLGAIETGAELFTNGKYQETMLILYPSIEHVLNSMIKKAGENPEKYCGWKKKAEWLENMGHLPPQITQLTSIIEGRNKTLHGNLSLEDEDLLKALCNLLFCYLSFLARKYKGND